jgi:hypothetical protein
MKLAAEDRDSLLKALERKGWLWNGDFIYASHKTMWLLGADPWQGDLKDFHERMSGRVERIIRNKDYHDDAQQHQHCVDDTESLIATLEELLKTKGDI